MYHYVYRITNTLLRKHYYGVRTSKRHPKDDLGVKYFSSSLDKEFIKDQKENPQNYKYKIICVVGDRKLAIALEIKLHNKFNVGVNEAFYNKAKQTSIGWDTTGKVYPGAIHYGKDNGMYGRKHSEESRKKISENTKLGMALSKDKPWKQQIISEATKKKISKTLLGQRWMKKDNFCIVVKEKEIYKFLQDGWIFGRIMKSRKSDPCPIDVS